MGFCFLGLDVNVTVLAIKFATPRGAANFSLSSRGIIMLVARFEWVKRFSFKGCLARRIAGTNQTVIPC